MLDIKCSKGKILIIGQSDIYPSVRSKAKTFIHEINGREVLGGVVMPVEFAPDSIWDKFEHLVIGDNDHILRAWSRADVAVTHGGELQMHVHLPSKFKPGLFLPGSHTDLFLGDFPLAENERDYSKFKSLIDNHQPFRRTRENR